MEPRIMSRRFAARACKAGLLALTDPRFNMREICKQMLLLEDHLLHQNKVCPDCIRKHLLTIESLAEEATSLNNPILVPPLLIENLAGLARAWLVQFTDKVEHKDIADNVRRIRKSLVSMYFDPRDAQSKVAHVLWNRLTGCSHRPSLG